MSNNRKSVVKIIVILAIGGVLCGEATSATAKRAVSMDYQLMYEEYLSAGGLKFLAKTEEMLRLAEFEEALMRYRFLKGQFKGSADYRAAIVSINQRLHFLKRQMHLTEADISPLPIRRVRLNTPPPPPPPPPPKPKPKTLDDEPPAVSPGPPVGSPGPPVVAPGAPTGAAPVTSPPVSTPSAPESPGTAAPAPTSTTSPAPTITTPSPAGQPTGTLTSPPAEPEKPQETKEAKPDAPPPVPAKKSFWQKVRGLVGW